VAFKYDARGRITKLVRYTDNLGFDGVFYKYNSLNQIISMRSIDPHRQFTTWYGTIFSINLVYTSISNCKPS